jgi:RHS repeat-associated protein
VSLSIESRHGYKFTAEERDSESNLDNFGFRHYGSSMGRFMSPDEPLYDGDYDDPQKLNLYSYVENNPVSRTDPDGPISKDGAVSAVTVVSGHPMLVPAAIEAVKKWQYKPFLIADQPVEVKTEIEVPFSLGISEADYRKEQDASNDYFKQEKKCRDLLEEHQYPDAEQSCKPLIKLSAKLPSGRRLERLTAYQYVGHAEFGQRKFIDALSFYKQELAIAEVALKPTDAELAYAYRDVARGLHGVGDLQQARSYYEHATSTLELARDHIDSAFLKNEYSHTMKTALQEYAQLLRQSGDSSGAEAAQQRADAIVVRDNLKDN